MISLRNECNGELGFGLLLPGCISHQLLQNKSPWTYGLTATNTYYLRSSVGQIFGKFLAGWLCLGSFMRLQWRCWSKTQHFESLPGAGGPTFHFQDGHLHGWWLKGSVPYHVGFSKVLLTTVWILPEREKESKTEAIKLFMTQSQKLHSSPSFCSLEASH